MLTIECFKFINEAIYSKICGEENYTENVDYVIDGVQGYLKIVKFIQTLDDN